MQKEMSIRTGGASSMTGYVGVKHNLSKHICIMTTGLLKIPLFCSYVLNVAVSGRAVQSFVHVTVKKL